MTGPDIEREVRRLASLAPSSAVESPELPREAYLDEAEELVRLAAAWQDGTGAVLDPWQNTEDCYETARFVGALGGLVGAGRCLDLLDHLDAAVARLAEFYLWQIEGSGPTLAVEFMSKELGWALRHARSSLSPATVAHVAEVVASAEPVRVYVDTLAHRPPEGLYNFNTFSLAGEQLLRTAGLRDDDHYIEAHLPHHRRRFTDLGLYCDPDAAVVYDWVPRCNLTTLIEAGFAGAGAQQISDLLRQGALTQLLLHNPQGLGWFGGRSNQYLFNEMQLCVICEYEATRWQPEDKAVAGMFRRAARLGLRAVRSWLHLDPPRHIKNAFPPAVGWGFDTYGTYAVYLMLAASLMTFAYHYASDDIEEAPLPSEITAYAMDLGPAFHQAVAHSPCANLQWDLKANRGYDATGLGRVLWAGAPLQLSLLAPAPGNPSYLLASWLRPAGEKPRRGFQVLRAAAASCAWQVGEDGDWQRLAEKQPESYNFTQEETDEGLRVTIVWSVDGGEVRSLFLLRDDDLAVTWEVPGAWRVRAEWPLLVTDGLANPEVSTEPAALVLRWDGWQMRVEGQKGSRASIALGVVANRNGLYHLGLLEAEGNSLTLRAGVNRLR